MKKKNVLTNNSHKQGLYNYENTVTFFSAATACGVYFEEPVFAVARVHGPWIRAARLFQTWGPKRQQQHRQQHSTYHIKYLKILQI